MNHIDHEAELYALGMLDDEERARIDEHLCTCEPCTVLVGNAEAAVAALIDSTRVRRPMQRAARWPIAVAAAFALTALGLLGQNFVLHGALSTDGALLATLIDSHFDHAQFQAASGRDIAAKAIYERHGKWYEILAEGTPAWHVVFVRPDGTRERAAAEFAQRGAASIVYLAPTTPVRSIELEDAAGRVVGSVKPALVAALRQAQGDKRPMVGDARPVMGDKLPVVGDKRPVMGDKRLVLGDARLVVGEGRLSP